VLHEDWKVFKTFPSLARETFKKNGSNLGRTFMRKFDGSGWELGQVTRPADAKDQSKGMNCTIRLEREQYERGMLLKRSEYYTDDDNQDDAPAGSWFFVQKD
jgi:hypothetical protein